MATAKYSYQGEKEGTARVYGRELRTSAKHCIEIGRNIRGKTVQKAINFLEKVKKMEVPVRFTVNKRKVPHKKGNIAAGRFPTKAAGLVSNLLKSAKENAENPDGDNLKIVSFSTNLGMAKRRGMRTVKRSHHRARRANIEIVLKTINAKKIKKVSDKEPKQKDKTKEIQKNVPDSTEKKSSPIKKLEEKSKKKEGPAPEKEVKNKGSKKEPAK